MCVCVFALAGLTCPAPVLLVPQHWPWAQYGACELKLNSLKLGHRLMTQPAQMTERNESEDHGYNREELSKPRRDAEFFTRTYSDANRELLSAGDVSADDETKAALPICCSMSCKLLRPVESNPLKHEREMIGLLKDGDYFAIVVYLVSPYGVRQQMLV